MHRDVKPGNILVTPDGRVLLTDFGIAKGLDIAGDDLTSDNVMMGTAKYLSPEQVRGKRLDGRADLYSLGLVLYECLAGRVPFLGETDADTALARLQRDPDRSRPPAPDAARSGSINLIHARSPATRRTARRPAPTCAPRCSPSTPPRPTIDGTPAELPRRGSPARPAGAAGAARASPASRRPAPPMASRATPAPRPRIGARRRRAGHRADRRPHADAPTSDPRPAGARDCSSAAAPSLVVVGGLLVVAARRRRAAVDHARTGDDDRRSRPTTAVLPDDVAPADRRRRAADHRRRPLRRRSRSPRSRRGIPTATTAARTTRRLRWRSPTAAPATSWSTECYSTSTWAASAASG